MQKRIIYASANGGVTVLIPALDCGLTVEQIALKDVPFNTPFKIVDFSELPTDQEFFDAWEADMSNPDGVGADYGFGSTNEVIGWTEDWSPILVEIAQ